MTQASTIAARYAAFREAVEPELAARRTASWSDMVMGALVRGGVEEVLTA